MRGMAAAALDALFRANSTADTAHAFVWLDELSWQLLVERCAARDHYTHLGHAMSEIAVKRNAALTSLQARASAAECQLVRAAHDDVALK